MIPGAFPILAGGAQKSVVFQEARHSSTNANSFTFTNVNLGYPDATRLIVVGVNYFEADTTVTLNSVVIGSTTAVSRVTEGEGVFAASYMYANISSASIPSGSTASITVSFSRSIDRGCSIGIWSIYNLQSATPVATAGGGLNTQPVSLSFSAQAEDIICAVLTGSDTAGATTFTGMTEDYDTTLNIVTRSGASTQASSAGTLTVTGQNTSGNTVMVAAQFR